MKYVSNNNGIISEKIDIDTYRNNTYNSYNNFFGPALDDDLSLDYCPECDTPLSISDIQNKRCSNCNSSVHEVIQPSNYSNYRNVPTGVQGEYSDKIYLIKKFIALRDYKEALLTCDEIIRLSPRSPEGWERKAFCYFLHNPKQEIIKSSGSKILELLSIAKENGLTTSEDTISRRQIANSLAGYLRNRINQLKMRSSNVDERRKTLGFLISGFNVCYSLFPNPKFLKVIISHFHGYHGSTWFDIQIDSVTPLKYTEVVRFPWSVFNLEESIEKIKKQDTSYKAPEIRYGEFSQYPGELLNARINTLLKEKAAIEAAEEQKRAHERQKKQEHEERVARIKLLEERKLKEFKDQVAKRKAEQEAKERVSSKREAVKNIILDILSVIFVPFVYLIPSEIFIGLRGAFLSLSEQEVQQQTTRNLILAYTVWILIYLIKLLFRKSKSPIS